MRDIEERLIEVRKALGLSQEKFGAPVGMSRSEIKNLEYGKTTLKDISIPLLCREYNIDETWLRTGAGEMFRSRSREDEIASFMAGLLGGDSTDFQHRLIAALAKLGPEEWALIEKRARELLDEGTKKDPVD